MEYHLKHGDAIKLCPQCIVVGVYRGGELSPSAKQIDTQSIVDALATGSFKAALGDTLTLFKSAGGSIERLLLIGLGAKDKLGAADFRRATRAAAHAVRKSGAREALLCLTEIRPQALSLEEAIREIVIACEDALYSFRQFKTDSYDKGKLEKLTLHAADKKEAAEAADALRIGIAIGAAVSLHKDLANLPGNVCTPSYLAEQAKAIKKGQKNIQCSILEEDDLEKLGMGAFLSVSRGSEQPAKLICLEYNGATSKSEPPVVLVGKGITFDTGGISIKPGAAMDEMKYDMCGAASVLATIKFCALIQPAINVVGIVAAAENMPDGRASRPGDIVKTMSGQTVEILNTDAEGRLVLCDALTYAERFKPELVIDIATLTGACMVALGSHAAGLMTTDDSLSTEILAAGEQSGDRAWRLPLWEEYGHELKSNFADMANIGGRFGGAIVAGVYLSKFTKKYRWAHLDIAGTAWFSGSKKGATGRPVPLLTKFLMNRATLKGNAPVAGKRKASDKS